MVLGLCLAPSAATADPDPSAPSLNGEAALRAGFPTDPRVIGVRAGGINRARVVGSQCTGYIANQPDYKITYQTGSGALPLIFSVQSGIDTMLAIRGPDGAWYCDDDSGGGTNPAIRFNNPLGGRYSIFVGTYGSGVNAAARLRISELTSTVPSARTFAMNGPGRNYPTPTAGNRPDPSGQSFNGSTSLSPDFGSRSVSVRAGGSINARVVGSQCTGFVGSRPDYKVEYRSGGPSGGGGKVGSGNPLVFTVDSSEDTMLAINGPDGRWYCDDDGGEGSNPLVRFNAPSSGRYDIFVGTYSSGDTADATLRISE